MREDDAIPCAIRVRRGDVVILTNRAIRPPVKDSVDCLHQRFSFIKYGFEPEGRTVLIGRAVGPRSH